MDNCASRQAPFRCSDALAQAIGAYHALMVGQTRVRVRHGDSEVEYDKRNIPALRQYIMSLHQACGGIESSAVLGIPRRRSPANVVFSESSVDALDCGCGPQQRSVQQDCFPCGS